MSDGSLEISITDLKRSLEQEIHAGFESINVRLHLQAARLERQTMLWESGRRWSGGMDTWATKIEAALETKDRWEGSRTHYGTLAAD
jgi:hypothetical protein